MKISEIEAGTEYALASESRYSSEVRHVKVIEVVSVEDPHGRWDNVRNTWIPTKVTKAKIKFLDAPSQSRSHDPKKGTVISVLPRLIAAPWSEVAPAIQEKKAEEQRVLALDRSLTKRVKALLGRNFDGYVSVTDRRATLDVRDKSLEKLLTLAEMGTRMKK